MCTRLLRALLSLVVFSVAIVHQAQAETLSACPSGFKPTAVAGVCVAQSLSTSVVQSKPATGQCLSGFDSAIGTSFCVKDYYALNRSGSNYLVSYSSSTSCPANFSRAPGSTLCTANHLALDYVDSALKLIEPRLNCPSGSVQLTGANLCSPIVSSTAPLSAPAGLDCPPGFLKPFGSHFCMAATIAIKTNDHTNFGITPPTEQCPLYWYRYQSGGFCLPATSIVACGSPDFPCRQESNDTYYVVKERLVCPVDDSTRQGTHSPYVPDDPLGLKAVPTIVCTAPVTNEHN